jgi:hypothetical protein
MAEEIKTFEQKVYGPDGKLTYEGMQEVIKAGGSVLINGSLIAHEAGLPSEATIAKGDAAREEIARKNLLAQRAALDAELARLGDTPSEDENDRTVLAQGFTFSGDPATTPPIVSVPGEGDTAGADGDASDPDSEAGKKAAAAQAEAEKAAKAEAKRLAAEAKGTS